MERRAYSDNKCVEHLEKIERLLKRYAQDYHFYLRDLVHDKVYELGTRKPYPICSCFKLAVLMAFFDSIESEEELHVSIEIPTSKFRPGVGVINFFTTPVQFSWFQLAQQMMAFSDSTSTDLIIERVGLDKVVFFLQKYTEDSALTQNLAQMISSFQTVFSIAQLKAGVAYADAPPFADVTNAKDLASLVEGAFEFKPKQSLRQSYLACLKAKKMNARTGLYFSPDIELVSKTGSLGSSYFANDCGMIRTGDKTHAVYGITAEGFVHDKEIVDIVFGLIGLKLLGIANISSEPNARYSRLTHKWLEDA
jgi:beta-lactamase class A